MHLEKNTLRKWHHFFPPVIISIYLFSDVTFPWPLPLLVSALTSLRQAHTDTVPPQGAPNNQQSLHHWRLNIDFHSVFECCIRPLTPYVPGLDIFHGLGISWIVNLCWVYLVRVAPSAWQLTFACLIRVPEAEYRAFRRWRRWGRQIDKLFFFFFQVVFALEGSSHNAACLFALFQTTVHFHKTFINKVQLFNATASQLDLTYAG